MGGKFKANIYTISLIVILIVAAILRFIGTNPGYHQFHPDENTIYSTAVDFIKNKNFEPYRYEYPALTNLINYTFYKFFFIPLGWIKFLALNFSKILDGQIKFPLGADVYNRVFQLEILGAQDKNPLFWGRYITAFFGVGVVWASYLVGKKLFGKYVGLISAFLVGINYRQVLNSHFGLPDIYNAFFFLLSFWSILHLREKVNFRRSLLCGVSLGLYLSTKYQFFPFIAFFLVYLEQALKKHNLREKMSALINPSYIVVPIISLLVFLILNPYLFINLKVAVDQISYAALKYGAGTMRFIRYPYWYLFNIGIGKITSFLIIAGILLGLFKERWKLVLLMSVIIPFFSFLTYLTSGGFYTRNFVSITPFLLIFAAYTTWWIGNHKPRIFFLFLSLAILGIALWENLSNSLIVLKEYTKPWNRQLIETWIIKNIPEGTKIAAHSSVPLPDNRIRITFDRWPWPYYSLAEFQEAGASYAIANLDWMDSDFYWWMRSSTYWGKPVAVMKKSYTALTIDELTDFGLYQETNPWQAPESNFIVAKVPGYTLISQEKIKVFNFKNDQPLTHWESEPIEIGQWQGFDIEYRMRMESRKEDYKDGVIFIKFYSNIQNALKSEDHIAVRLSKREDKSEIWDSNKLIGKVPQGAEYATLGFLVTDINAATYFLDKIKLYKAVVLEDLGGVKVRKIKIDENILFPNSHGNL